MPVALRHTARRVRRRGRLATVGWVPGSDVFEVGGVAYRWEPLCALRDALPAAFRKAPRRPPPSTPALYRLRRVGRTELDYIGQTGSGGMTLRKRVRMLASIMARSCHSEIRIPRRQPYGHCYKGRRATSR